MIIMGVLALLLGFAYWYTYPRLGHYLYAYGNTLEAKLYGFTANTFELEGVAHRVWLSHQSNKPMLLLVHGFTANHSSWLRYAKHFTDDYFVVIPDLAGHGESGFSAQTDYSIAAQSDRLIDLIKTLRHKQAHVIGNSMGGFIAAHMARYYPDYCESIVLIDAAGVSSPKPSKMGLMLSEDCNPFDINNDAEFARFYAMVMARPPYIPRVVRAALSQYYQTRNKELMKIWKDFNRQGNYIEQELDKINCPSLIIWGARDALIDVSSVEVWAKGLNSQQHVWHDLGHMPMLEAPERTAYATRTFLKQQKK